MKRTALLICTSAAFVCCIGLAFAHETHGRTHHHHMFKARDNNSQSISSKQERGGSHVKDAEGGTAEPKDLNRPSAADRQMELEQLNMDTA
jgi:hypothetical protein